VISKSDIKQQKRNRSQLCSREGQKGAMRKQYPC